MSKETPDHVNFETLGAFAELRDGAPDLPRDIGSSVVFLVMENGTYKMLNGRIFGIHFYDKGTTYDIMTRNGCMFDGTWHGFTVAV